MCAIAVCIEVSNGWKQRENKKKVYEDGKRQRQREKNNTFILKIKTSGNEAGSSFLPVSYFFLRNMQRSIHIFDGDR